MTENKRDGRGGESAPEIGIREVPFTRAFFANSQSSLQLKKDMIVRTAYLFYKKWILHGLLRKYELPHTKNGRHIVLDVSRDISLIDERTGKAYINNAIRSSRYTIWTFLPGQIWFQFSKIANLYFLIIGAVQLIPGLSTTGTYTTILPLVIFLVLTILREGWDDFRRYRQDRMENRRLARVLYGYRPGGIEGQRKHIFRKAIERCWQTVKGMTKRQVRTRIEEMSPPSQTHNSSKATASVKTDSSESDLWATVEWLDLEVGDVVELKRNEQVPADIVLLYADGRDRIAYVETMALDGETNLKNREPPRLLHLHSSSDIPNCNAHFVVEDPNLDLYDFNGKVSVDGVTLPLTANNVIYRGSILRNTTRAIGMVINTGEECKVRMNANKNPQVKAPAIQTRTNRVVVLLAVFVILLAVGCTAGYEIWTPVYEKKAWYLTDAHLAVDEIFIAFAIEFNNLIPLALYVSLELVKLAQFLLLRDIEMYDPCSDTPMVSNTQNIYENLGQVNYILSDKTGTLTENVMQLRKISVSGTAWVHNLSSHVRVEGKEKDGDEMVTTSTIPTQADRRDSTVQILSTDTPAYSQNQYTTDELLQSIQRNPSSTFAKNVLFFILSLAVCHTGFPEIKDEEISFQAASPDELALLEAARDLGYIVIDRTSHSITLQTTPPGIDPAVRETYEVLDVIEFSSKRKRMSIIVRFPDGRICLFCKGADSVILPISKLSSIALQTASRIERIHNQRVSLEVEEAVVRKSREQESRNSFHRPSLNLSVPSMTRRSSSFERRSFNSIREYPDPSDVKSQIHLQEKASSRFALRTPRASIGDCPTLLLSPPGVTKTQTDHPSSPTDDGTASFENCLQHIHDFACEGLRTLIYGHRFINDEEYTIWKKGYDDATISLTNRQEMIEAAAETIEQNFDIAGATGIEDKLQKGVPETIDKLQRANIKIWMLTGDKRETAINIAQSARICKSYSHIIVLDCEKGDVQQQIASAIQELTETEIPHSVVIIDGQTLAGIENDEDTLFYDLLIRTDSVICCRASPSQKAAMVKHIRRKVRGSITLAIGDGANDVVMLQEADVGVGISGKEGLQASRVADYSIAQFRFLQRLLLVHGHWNYVRTTKYIIFTFWKEMLFYSIQVLYQRWNGYTGTSLFESDSLTVWNTLFTALPVMIPGIFEQDLSAATLLAVPELYSYGQENRGFNVRNFSLSMLNAACEALIIYFMIYGLYGLVPLTIDKGLFALGDLAFTVCVIFINIKLLILQYHYKTWIPIFCALLTIAGWWAWNLFLCAIYSKEPGPYGVYGAFTHYFGRDVVWWAVLVAVLAVIIVLELVLDSIKRWGWPSEIEIWQELERDESVRKRLLERGGEGGYSMGVVEGF